MMSSDVGSRRGHVGGAWGRMSHSLTPVVMVSGVCVVLRELPYFTSRTQLYMYIMLGDHEIYIYMCSVADQGNTQDVQEISLSKLFQRSAKTAFVIVHNSHWQ